MIAEFWRRFQAYCTNVPGWRGAIPGSQPDGYVTPGRSVQENIDIINSIACGDCTAFFSTVTAHQRSGLTLPRLGTYLLVQDTDGLPMSVVRCTGTQLVEYRDMTDALARKEGLEDSLFGWQQRWRRLLREEAIENGLPMTTDVTFVIVTFTRVYWEEPFETEE